MTFLVIVHIVISLFLVLVILLQAGKADMGIGFGSSSQSIFGSKGAGNFLTKTTTVCAVLFLTTSFILTRSRLKEYQDSVIGAETPAAQTKTETAPAPTKTEEKKDDKNDETKK